LASRHEDAPTDVQFNDVFHCIEVFFSANETMILCDKAIGTRPDWPTPPVRFWILVLDFYS